MRHYQWIAELPKPLFSVAVLLLIAACAASLYAQSIPELDEVDKSDVSLTLWLADPRWSVHRTNDLQFTWGDDRFQYTTCEWTTTRVFDGGVAIMLSGCDPRVFLTLGPFGGNPEKDMHVSLLDVHWTMGFEIEEGKTYIRGGAPIQNKYSTCYTYTGDGHFELVCTSPDSILERRFDTKLDFLLVFPDGSNPLVGDFTGDLRGALLTAIDYFDYGVASSKLVAQDDVDISGYDKYEDRIGNRTWGEIKKGRIR